MQLLGQFRTRKRWTTTWGLEQACAVTLLVSFVFLAASSIRQKSPTFDEVAHITGGYSYWTTHDYRLQPENGAFTQRWVALPLLPMDLRFPSMQQPAWTESQLFSFSSQFFHAVGNDAATMLWRSRLMVILLTVCLGYVVFLWSRHLFGSAGGLLALLFFAFSPTILAYGRLATSDMAVTFTLIVWLALFWTAIHRLTPVSLVLGGLAMGLALTAKMSGILVFPVAAVLLVIRLVVNRPLILQFGRTRVLRRRWAQTLVCAGLLASQLAVATLIVWALFGFRYQVFREFEPGQDSMDWLGGNSPAATLSEGESNPLASSGALGTAIDAARRHRVLPEAYLHGLAYVLVLASLEGHEDEGFAFFRGEYSQLGWITFFPFCFLAKTAPAVFVMLGLAAYAARIQLQDLAKSCGNRSTRRAALRVCYRTAPLWTFLIIYWAAALTVKLNLGARHILPTYPILFILMGAAAFWLRVDNRWVAMLVPATCVGVVVSSLSIYPHYLAYFNFVTGGPRQAYRQLVDSSLDWGQDLPGLKTWLDSGQYGDLPVYLSYFGTGDPTYYGIEAKKLPSWMDWKEEDEEPATGGLYCISATMLQCVYPRTPRGPWTREYEQYYQRLLGYREILDQMTSSSRTLGPEEQREIKFMRHDLHAMRFARLCSFLRQREPDDSVGYSILIYRLTDEDLQHALYGPVDVAAR